ncbi:RDD family protein [Paenalcaligenes hominis]|nr:RDD family protein [Paenalcaligenes hominis]
MVYEGILLFGIVFGVLLLFDFLTQSRHALFLRDARQVILFLSIGLYFLLCWRRTGQTLPMKTWHMRLQMADGSKPSWLRALYRYLLMWVIPLVFALALHFAAAAVHQPALLLFIVFTPLSLFIWTWVDPDTLFLHDRLAGTRIVDLRPHIKQ